MGTVNILEAVRLTPSVKSFVNVTTDKVYENREWYWGYRENENLCGHDPYSNSKSCSELVTYSYRNSFFNAENAPAISTARSGNVIGGGDYSEDRIIPDCIRAANTGKDIILRNPCSTRPYQHILDCLSGYLLLADKQYSNKELEGNYNFGPNEESCVSTGALAELFCETWGGDICWTTRGDNNLHEANFFFFYCSKSKAVFVWKSCLDITTAVERSVEFAKIRTDNERNTCVDNQIDLFFNKTLNEV
jgi:CDP-glucose 4,6-dehydratase